MKNTHILKNSIGVIALVSLAGSAIIGLDYANAKPGTSRPNSKAYGKSLQSWMNSFWVSNFTGAGPDERVGRVTLLTIPAGEFAGGSGTPEEPWVFVGAREVTMRPGSPFALGVLAWAGESYVEEECADDVPLPPDLFLEANVLITLDGHALIDSEVDDLGRYYYEATEFDPPLAYGEPQNRGACNADAAIWIQGLGFLHGPLTPGEHSLVLDAGATFPGDVSVRYINTWTITVSR